MVVFSLKVEESKVAKFSFSLFWTHQIWIKETSTHHQHPQIAYLDLSCLLKTWRLIPVRILCWEEVQNTRPERVAPLSRVMFWIPLDNGKVQWGRTIIEDLCIFKETNESFQTGDSSSCSFVSKQRIPKQRAVANAQAHKLRTQGVFQKSTFWALKKKKKKRTRKSDLKLWFFEEFFAHKYTTVVMKQHSLGSGQKYRWIYSCNS